jgi:hypothetical protein
MLVFAGEFLQNVLEFISQMARKPRQVQESTFLASLHNQLTAAYSFCGPNTGFRGGAHSMAWGRQCFYGGHP